MNEFTHYFSDGSPVRIVLKQTAKKNIILRPLAADALSVNAPKWLGRRRLEAWLAANGETLRQTLGRWTERPSENGADGLPEAIWFRGCRAAVAAQGGISRVLLAPECILLPEAAPAEQRRLLKTALRECAAQTLLPRLHGHAGRLNLHPAAVRPVRCEDFLGRMPRPHGDTAQLAAGTRAGFCCRLRLRTRTLPPAASEPQRGILGAGRPPYAAHAGGEGMAQSARAGAVCTGLGRTQRPSENTRYGFSDGLCLLFPSASPVETATAPTLTLPRRRGREQKQRPSETDESAANPLLPPQAGEGIETV
ncbi:YgjP-like metallopeptidase domain-containing protein [Kingella potus]|uniref:YgjP-like metallopeptidase domain-containing protein n=1 Tax=Kingella potus TaxID=265175 RepID=UPI003CC7F8B9